MECRQNAVAGREFEVLGMAGFRKPKRVAAYSTLEPSKESEINNTSSVPAQLGSEELLVNRKGILFRRVKTVLCVVYISMAQNAVIPPDLNSLSLSDSDADNTEDLFASPSVPTKNRRPDQRPETLGSQPSAHPPDTEEDHLAAHEASLRRELSSVRSINQIVSGVVDSLEKAKSNMETVSATVSNASTLLTTWTRILSQTEHNQRLLLNPHWQGASQDVADGENEALLRRQEKERREAEEARREEVRAREKEEEERRKMTEGPTAKGPRGRGRGVGRGVGRAGGNGYVGVGGQGGVRGTARAGGTAPGRAGSGIGRGIGSGRGRARGP